MHKRFVVTARTETGTPAMVSLIKNKRSWSHVN